ncbi:type I-C CRISPR-associated protein Cas7/Csd2 [Frankia sp. CNm7]|uniref:Type I-C CRISPR-associated protein Cas7/Csd2 n=1 Tax=Frankia nepalensis TaxID=1836974 RepID=A0A937UV88_9ACTN|nr:type I-C CRISPR-associated protein Cas7/Csd2 [Frankia nepalensis]MBL7499885.1 type I-C CRISPR-associated protein Cas7/Csd2 [Frankia nepalensis]MBL7512297.1 type I-C CRISPR-associated protein Cas7/Csd2 [Frankia nepalensis]MBL7516980.1 type I-C CRISPR-associated protein Cas7/Csd2 [Frankia nepalensis]MBL7631981.1 type I-C CRISPR-associated protein Cas7/Csd2 [Frankia nepalensis]
MSSYSLDPAVKHDLVFLFDVADGNPNGDPDAGNRPRTDDETGHGLVSDVALKRKVRDTIGLAAESAGLDLARYQIFVEAGHALNTRLEASYTDNGFTPGEKLTGEQATQARDWLTARYVDIRLFGAVMSTGRTSALGQIRGPIQVTIARSIDPVNPVDHAITRVTQTRQADIDQGERTEMGSKWTVPYGLYRAEIHYSAPLGKRTKVSTEDLDLLLRTLINMFDHDRSATRGEMATRGLYVFSHSDAFGAAPAHTLASRIRLQRISDGAPRSFDDYKVDIDDANLPTGVRLTRVLG